MKAKSEKINESGVMAYGENEIMWRNGENSVMASA
jgi:hypothetical protein